MNRSWGSFAAYCLFEVLLVLPFCQALTGDEKGKIMIWMFLEETEIALVQVFPCFSSGMLLVPATCHSH